MYSYTYTLLHGYKAYTCTIINNQIADLKIHNLHVHRKISSYLYIDTVTYIQTILISNTFNISV